MALTPSGSVLAAAFLWLLFSAASAPRLLEAAPGRSRSSVVRIGGRGSSHSGSRSSAAAPFKAPSTSTEGARRSGSLTGGTGSSSSGRLSSSPSSVSSPAAAKAPSSADHKPSLSSTGPASSPGMQGAPNSSLSSAGPIYQGAPQTQTHGSSHSQPGTGYPPGNFSNNYASYAPTPAPSPSASSPSLAKQALAAGAASAAGAFVGSALANQMTRHHQDSSSSGSGGGEKTSSDPSVAAASASPATAPPRDSPTDVLLRFPQVRGEGEGASSNALSLESASAIARSVQTAAAAALEIPESRMQLKALSLSDDAAAEGLALDLTFSLLPSTLSSASRTLDLAEELSRQSKDSNSAFSSKLRELRVLPDGSGSAPVMPQVTVPSEKRFFASLTAENSAKSPSCSLAESALLATAVVLSASLS